MVSTEGGWIIIAILIFVFVILGLLYWYWHFIYEPRQQIQLAASERAQPPAADFPAVTPDLK